MIEDKKYNVEKELELRKDLLRCRECTARKRT